MFFSCSISWILYEQHKIYHGTSHGECLVCEHLNTSWTITWIVYEQAKIQYEVSHGYYKNIANTPSMEIKNNKEKIKIK